MLNEGEREEIDILQEQVANLQFQLSAQKSLILALMSELGSANLRGFNPFAQTIKAELKTFPSYSDEYHDLKLLLDKYIDRASYESDTCPVK